MGSQKLADLLCPVDPSAVVLVELFGLGIADEEVAGLLVLDEEDLGGVEETWSTPVSSEWSHSFGCRSPRLSIGLLCTCVQYLSFCLCLK